MPKLNGYPLALYGILETQDKLRKEIQRVTAEHHGGDLGYDIECPSEYSRRDPCQQMTVTPETSTRINEQVQLGSPN